MKRDEPDELIESAFENLRSLPVPEGPTADLLDETRRRVRSMEVQSPPKQFWRNILMRTKNPIAAALLVSIGVAVAVVMLRSPGVTYADVITKVSQAHLVQFDAEESGTPPSHTSVIISNDGVEYYSGPGWKQIITYKGSRRQLVLTDKTKTADLYIGPIPENRPKTLLDNFREMVNKPSKDLGPEDIDGHHAEKFVVVHSDHMEGSSVIDRSGKVVESHFGVVPETYTLWADIQSGDLLRVEQVDGTGADARKTVYDHFKVDPVLTAEELSTDVPAEYALRICGMSLMTPHDWEKTVVQTLRDYAAQHDGKFPPDESAFPADVTFTGPESLLVAASKEAVISQAATNPSIKVGETKTGEIRMMMRVDTTIAPSAPKPETQPEAESKIVWAWEYYTGKSMGDGSTLVLWYKVGADGGRFRGIYNDLSVRDMSEMPMN